MGFIPNFASFGLLSGGMCEWASEWAQPSAQSRVSEWVSTGSKVVVSVRMSVSLGTDNVLNQDWSSLTSFTSFLDTKSSHNFPMFISGNFQVSATFTYFAWKLDEMNIPLGWESAYWPKLLGGKLRRGKRWSGMFHEEFIFRVLEGEWGVGICMKYSIKYKEGHLRQLGKFLAAR